MSTTNTTPAAETDARVATGAAQFLTPIAHGLQALAINGKQAHWNVRGANFIAIHELFDSVVAHAREWSDDAAERVVSLGLPIDARLRTVAERVAPTQVDAGFSPWEESVAALVSDIDALISDIDSAITALDDIDLTSQDLVISIKAGLEKDRWFLVAHLAK